MARKLRMSRMERLEKRKQRNTIIMGAILVILMVASTFAIFGGDNSVSDGSVAFNYSGYSFSIQNINGNNIYVTNVNGVDMPFYSTPFEADALNISPVFKTSYLFAPVVIITSDAPSVEGTIPVHQSYIDAISNEVAALTGKNVLRGYLQEDFFGEKQQLDCGAADNTTPVIFYHGPDEKLDSLNGSDSRGAGIYETDTFNCYEFVGDELDIILLRDYLVYYDLGILK